jgi:phosphoribosyl-ATP pyrophosphohydrolase
MLMGMGKHVVDATWDRAAAAIAAYEAAPRRHVEKASDSFDALISAARVEADKAMRKFPQPNYVISKVAEEAGEVVKAAIHCAENRETAENVAGEMRQLIAMLYRLWVEGDQVHGLPPVGGALHIYSPEQIRDMPFPSPPEDKG